MDGRPVLGESAMVFGQGVVGLLVTALLRRFPLSSLVTFDRCRSRRRVSMEWGADAAHDPALLDDGQPARAGLTGEGGSSGPDLVFEVSGDPAGLNQALRLAGFDTRIVVGSWYGRQQVGLDLGGAFHRRRIQLISSQVSTISPGLTGRWSKARRFETVMKMIRALAPRRLVTHRFPIDRAAEAYRLLDRLDDDVLQVVFAYE
jgi:threonine dehydrogenase-like Zn-dependent dehydrogenase